MKDLISAVFEVLAKLFDKIPLLNKLKGYRSVLGFIGLAVLAVLSAKGVGDSSVLEALKMGFMGFTGMSLLASGRDE